jgi:hypothetical protein
MSPVQQPSSSPGTATMPSSARAVAATLAAAAPAPTTTTAATNPPQGGVSDIDGLPVPTNLSPTAAAGDDGAADPQEALPPFGSPLPCVGATTRGPDPSRPGVPAAAGTAAAAAAAAAARGPLRGDRLEARGGVAPAAAAGTEPAALPAAKGGEGGEGGGGAE